MLIQAPRQPRALRRADLALSPVLVFYELTQACDLVCLHCRACAQTRPHAAELDTTQAKLLIDQLGEFPQPPMLILTGGDPFKRTDLFELVDHAVAAGLKVSITPSATPLASRRAIFRLRDAGVSRLAVSIDGADPAAHDTIRGVEGSFERSLEILADARDAGLSTQVNSTLSKGNVEQLDRLADLLAWQGIDLWSVFFLVPVGRARREDCLSAEACEAVFAQLWEQAQRQPYAIKTTEAPHYRRYVIQHQVAARRDGEPGAPLGYIPLGVNDGKGVLFVGHTGLIYPSGFLPIVCGLFPLQHVARVYQDSPVFRALRDADRLGGKCGRCEFRQLCGGSRARAYAVTGDPLAQEPDCVYVPAVEAAAT